MLPIESCLSRSLGQALHEAYICLQCFLRTCFYTLHTKNTLRSIFSFSGIIRHIHIHRAHFLAFSTGYALFFITLYPKQRKITHRLQEYGYRAEILTKCPIVLKCDSQGNTNTIVCDISNNKCPENNMFNISDLRQKKCRHKYQ